MVIIEDRYTSYINNFNVWKKRSKIEKFTEYIIGYNVYSSQSYLSRINTNARGCNPGLELINSECRATRQLTHYHRVGL